MSKIGQRLIFEKDYQQDLKCRYLVGLMKIWRREDDVDFINKLMSNIAVFIPICGGKYILTIDKPSIQKEFFFGYSDIGQGPSFEENQKTMDNVKANLVEYFKRRNLENIDSKIATFENILNGASDRKLIHGLKYNSSPIDSPIHGFGIEDPHSGAVMFAWESYFEEADIKNLIYGYKFYRELVEKKLDSYLKTYGTKKIIVRSYWIDR